MSNAPRLEQDVTPARRHYAEQLESLYQARDVRELSMDEESDRAGELEDLWYQLTPTEQEEIEALGRAYNSGFRLKAARVAGVAVHGHALRRRYGRASGVRYVQLAVYPYMRPGQRAASYAVATGDRPEDVVHRTNSKPAAITWAKRRSADVRVIS
jgi:hypothetical protein